MDNTRTTVAENLTRMRRATTKSLSGIARWTGRARQRCADWLEPHLGDRPDGTLLTMLALAALSAAAAVALLLVLLVRTLVDLISWIASAPSPVTTAAPADKSWQHDVAGAAVRMWHLVTDSITSWLAQHTAGLAVTPAALLITWGVAGAVLVLAGMCGSRGARIAWPLYGAASAAMAWLGATEPHRPIAAGVTGLLWALGSIVVLHRGGTRPRPQPVHVEPRVVVTPSPARRAHLPARISTRARRRPPKATPTRP